MNGFERELQSRVLSVIPHGELEGVNGPLHDYTKTMNQALKHEHVVAAAPYVRFTGLAEKGSKLKAIEVRGVELLSSKRCRAYRILLIKKLGKTFMPVSSK